MVSQFSVLNFFLSDFVLMLSPHIMCHNVLEDATETNGSVYAAYLHKRGPISLLLTAMKVIFKGHPHTSTV